MSSTTHRFHFPSSPRRWRWSALFLLCFLPLAVPAQISEAKIEALVEALRLSAPPVDADSGLYSDWGIKPDNIARWSRRCLDRDVTPEQFAADQALARRVLVCVLGPGRREGGGTCVGALPLATGISTFISFWISASSPASSGEQRATACPSRPARAVRPMRWT